MSPKNWLMLGALLAAGAVGTGAFGAHGLPNYLAKQELSAELLTKRLADFDTAAQYHMTHAIAIILVGLLALARPACRANVAGWSFVLGIALFSGCLYALVVTGQTKLGMIVPIGGVAFIVGWIALAITARKAI